MNPPPTILCIHGVGLWPGLFNRLDLGRPFEPLVRSGYGAEPAVDDLAGQVETIADAVSRHAPVVLIGVSGGATLALACAVRAIPGLVAVVTHEPLIGRLEIAIDDRVRAGAQTLEANRTAEAAAAFLDGLYGETSWNAMPTAAHRWAADHVNTVCREVRHFSEYQPTLEELRSVAVAHLTTVGGHSSPARHRVAALLEHGGARPAVIAGSGHHVLVDQPDRFSSTVRQFLSEVT